VGMNPLLTERTAKRHDWLVDEIAALGLSRDAEGFGDSFSWRVLADALGGKKKGRTAHPSRRRSRK
jgi:hypothetical protein